MVSMAATEGARKEHRHENCEEENEEINDQREANDVRDGAAK